MAIDNKDKKVLKSSIEREQNEVACSAECEKIKGSKNLNVPPLRFPEFSGEWEKRTLEDVSEFSKERMNTQNLSSDNYVATENMLHDYQGIIEASSVPTNTNVIKFNKGDVLLSNIRPYLKKVWFADKNGGCSADVFVFKALSACIPDFLHYIIANDRFINFAMSGAKGVKMPRGDKEQMKTYEIGLPSIEEQKKIAKLLSLLDERITTQNKIIEDLKKLKSAISLKMLHSDSWEQFSIKDIAIIGRGRVISSVEISQQKNPTYPVYSSQTSNEGIMGYLDDYMFEGEYISWTTDGANAGTVFYRNGKFNCTNVCGLLKLKKGFDTHFVSLVLAEVTKKYVSINLANPKLMNNTMGKIQIRLPKLEEQKRTSLVFRRLHKLLATHNSLLTEYSKQKQYLLSQMFI
ncbi:restriction endonuclease subunit S [Bacteroides ovatus]|uniref:restriction endonuclease subunit S n=1 Tax=Bacteroides ovatus TaxID=28116 RepID=UPI0022E73861|nr:restriction endonuclease subunit S [Bacteroides ovatus]